ncbi:MAG: apolipoprotein N-acyltransferase [Deltaproteobacteria bacterium]|nr:apolipoprotein N-acyltransferase [Deltaproteobacteria bacterium]
MAESSSWRPPWRTAGAALLSGLAAVLAYPPTDWWWLTPWVLTPLLVLTARLTPRQAGVTGFLWGLGLYTGQLYWIMVVMTVYGGMVWPLALGVLLLFAAVLAMFPLFFAWLAAQAAGRKLWLIAAPAAWVGLEWVRSFFLTGFPWLPLGGGLAARPELVQTAEWWGVHGVSFLMALTATLTAWPLTRPRAESEGWAARLAGPAAALALLGVLFGWGAWRMQATQALAAAAPHMPVSVIQANNEQLMLWNPQHRDAVLKKHLQLTRQAAAGVKNRPWLAVWPESAAPFYLMIDGEPSRPVVDLANQLDCYLCVGSLGAVSRDDKVMTTNRSWLLSPRGALGYYDKVHLVPFGEYVPLGSLLFFVRAVAQVGEDQARGELGRVLPAGPARLGPLICYESIFSYLAREMVLRGANLLVNQTNDAWFGRTGASRQHMSHLVFRAVENRRAVARAANTGVSGFVWPDGRITDTTELYTPAFRTRELPLLNSITLFTRLGDWAGPGAFLFSLIFAAGLRWRGGPRQGV